MRVVTADDHKIMEGVLRQIVTSMGHEHIGHAYNGEGAIALCREHRPDIVILDVIMPPKNGDEAAPVIADERLADFIILATSSYQQPIADLAERLGAKLVKKPYQPIKLKRVIEEIERESIGRRAHGDGHNHQRSDQ